MPSGSLRRMPKNIIKTLKKKQKAKDAVMREWFSWINSTNAGELAKSFEKHLADHGYAIKETQ